jgi:hypothetical protein
MKILAHPKFISVWFIFIKNSMVNKFSAINSRHCFDLRLILFSYYTYILK